MIGKLFLDGNGEIPLKDVEVFLEAISGAYVKLSIIEILMIHGRRGQYRASSSFDKEKIYYHLLSIIERSIREINHKSILESDVGYQFPTKKFIATQKELYGMFPSEKFVNESEDTIYKLISDIKYSLISRNSSSFIVTGKIGSGKSTFINYLHYKIIETKKFENILSINISANNHKELIYINDDFSRKSYRNNFSKTLINETVYQIIKYVVHNKKVDVFSHYLKEEAVQLSIIRKKTSQQITALLDYIKSSDRITTTPLRLISQLDDFLKTSIIEYSKIESLKFLYLLDGFEVLFDSHSIRESNIESAKYLLDIVFRNRNPVIEMGVETPVFLFTMTDSAYSYVADFFPSYESTPQNLTLLRLCPISPESVIQRGINNFQKQAREYGDIDIVLFTELLRTTYEIIEKRLELEYNGVYSLFYGNYRRIISFYLDVVKSRIDNEYEKRAYTEINALVDSILNRYNKRNIYIPLDSIKVNLAISEIEDFYRNQDHKIRKYSKFNSDYQILTSEKLFEPSNLLYKLIASELELSAVKIASPGVWEIIGKLNPLQALREYLNDRHERIKDNEYRNKIEKESLMLDILEKKTNLAEKQISLLRDNGVSKKDIKLFLRSYLSSSFDDLDHLQNKNVISKAEVKQLTKSKRA